MLDCNDYWIKDHNFKQNDVCLFNNKIQKIDNLFNYNNLSQFLENYIFIVTN